MRRNPPQPGESIREGCMEEVTVGEAAHKLGFSRHTLSRALNGWCGISIEMAMTLEAIVWSNAEFRTPLQTPFDLA